MHIRLTLYSDVHKQERRCKAKSIFGRSTRPCSKNLEFMCLSFALLITIAALDSALRSFISGGFGGMCLVMVGHPLDLAKVKLQTGTEYKGAMDVFKKIIRTEGPIGLYRGVQAPLLGVSPIFATCFWGYDMGVRFMRYTTKKAPGEALTLTETACAGALSAIPTTLLMVPVERVKCLLQIQGNTLGPPKYSGMADCATQLLREGGMKSLFRGFGATLLRDVPGSMAYFGVNVYLKRKFGTEEGTLPGWQRTAAILAAGGFAGMANWAVAIPPDTLKSRLQTAPEGKYTGLVDVYRTLMREEGASALFRGFGPAMLRAFPANAACFFGVDIASNFLNKVGLH